jgi:hypothetical protein
MFVSEGFQESDISEDKPSLYHFELVSRSSLYVILYSFKFNSWSLEIARNFFVAGEHILLPGMQLKFKKLLCGAIQSDVACGHSEYENSNFLCFATNFYIFLLCSMSLTSQT